MCICVCVLGEGWGGRGGGQRGTDRSVVTGQGSRFKLLCYLIREIKYSSEYSLLVQFRMVSTRSGEPI